MQASPRTGGSSLLGHLLEASLVLLVSQENLMPLGAISLQELRSMTHPLSSPLQSLFHLTSPLHRLIGAGFARTRPLAGATHVMPPCVLIMDGGAVSARSFACFVT